MRRWLALDRLRALAILLMVQGHTFSALLKPGEMGRGAERLHALIHGVTAPMFLVGAGLAFGVTSYPRFAAQRRDPALFKARMRRCLTLLAIGYALQLPGGSPIAAFGATGAERALLLRVGPLQLIAVTLCVSQLLMRAIASPRAHALALAALGLAISACTPAIWKGGYAAQLGVGLGSWLDDSFGSHFSLFPWASFTFLGSGIAGLVVSSGSRPRGLPFVAAGALLAGAAYALFSFELVGFEQRRFWHTSPCYVAFRLGVVLLFVGVLHWREQAAARSELLAIVTRRSLTAYVAHLLLLYGTPLTPNLAYRFAQRLSLVDTSAVCAAVLLLTVTIVYLLELHARAERPALLTSIAEE
jgi:hypothetical protein